MAFFRIDEHKLGPVMQFVSRLGSPQYAFTLFFPLLLAVHSSVGVRYLWVAIISDWLNMVLKWYYRNHTHWSHLSKY